MTAFSAASAGELGSVDIRTEDNRQYTSDEVTAALKQARRDERVRIVNELMAAGEPIAAEIVKAG